MEFDLGVCAELLAFHPMLIFAFGPSSETHGMKGFDSQLLISAMEEDPPMVYRIKLAEEVGVEPTRRVFPPQRL